MLGMRVELQYRGRNMKRQVMIDGIRLQPAEAKRIIDEAVDEARQAGRTRSVTALVALLVALLIAAVGSGWLTAVLIRLLADGSLPLSAWLISTSLLTALIVGLSYHPLMRVFHRREIRAAMNARGFELCPQCGYWLKGLGADSPRCPECGAQHAEAAK
jgi:hypothetical protein